VRVIGEIEAGLGICGASGCIDLERTYLPIRRDRPYQQEKPYECGEEEQETTTPPAALFLRGSGREIRQAHPRSTLAPSDYDLCFAPALLSARRYGLVTVP
jgi:hypothetical protein